MPFMTKGSVGAVLLAALSVLVLLYMTIADTLLGFVALGFLWVAYVLFQLGGILARIATSLDRLVDQGVEREREQ